MNGMKALYVTLGLGLCALVFAAYTRPDFVVNMANQIWLCF
jgi:hypothetical protein